MSEYDYDDDGYNGSPDPDNAAQHLVDFVSWFGDGNVYAHSDSDEDPACHSRDIAAVLTAYRDLKKAHAPSSVLRHAASYLAAVNVKLRPEELAHVCDFLDVYADQLEVSE